MIASSWKWFDTIGRTSNGIGRTSTIRSALKSGHDGHQFP
jgi:hypothetical protein